MTTSDESSGSIDIRIRWERRAVKEVAKLPEPDRERVVAAVEGLRDNPTKGSILSAVWKGFRRLRIGPYRVIYAYEGRDLLISVIRVASRLIPAGRIGSDLVPVVTSLIFSSFMIFIFA